MHALATPPGHDQAGVLPFPEACQALQGMQLNAYIYVYTVALELALCTMSVTAAGLLQLAVLVSL